MNKKAPPEIAEGIFLKYRNAPYELGLLIVSYRISKDAKVLARLKLGVIMHNRMGYRKPMIFRRFHLDEMRRDTPYQMSKGQGRKPDMAVIERNKLYVFGAS